jgi:hypothetical protein
VVSWESATDDGLLAGKEEVNARKQNARVSSTTRRRKNLCRAIQLTYDSLKTHIPHAIKSERAQLAGDTYFNAKTVREYAEIILICAVELEFISKKTRSKRIPKLKQNLLSVPATGK